MKTWGLPLSCTSGDPGQPRRPGVPTFDPSHRSDGLVSEMEQKSHLCILSLIQNTFKRTPTMCQALSQVLQMQQGTCAILAFKELT